MDQLERSIQELEQRIANYRDHGDHSPEHTVVNQNPEGTLESTDVDYNGRTEHLTPSISRARLRTSTPAAGHSGLFNRRDHEDRAVRFKSPIDDMYDLSKYLNKPDRETSSSAERVSVDHDEMLRDTEDGITFRRKPAAKQSVRRTETSSVDAPKQRSFFKPATYDGLTPWRDYKTHFDSCAKLGKWSEEEKALYLAVSLRGQAQAVLGDQPDSSNIKYNELLSALEDRFSPKNQTELYRVQLRERKQRAAESLPELGQHIRRLTNLAYPTAPQDVKETLAKEQFIDALVNSDMRLRIKQSRPDTLNEAIRHAVELDAFLKAESRVAGTKGYLRSVEPDSLNDNSEVKQVLSKITSLQETVHKLQQDFVTMKTKPAPTSAQHYAQPPSQNTQTPRPHGNRRRTVRCYYCKEEGHIKSRCPKLIDQQQKKHSSRGHNSHMKAGDAGMFVDARIGQQKWRALIDTGATVSIISAKMFYTLEESCVQPLQPIKRKVLSATDQPLNVLGKTLISILIGDHSYDQEVVVADVNFEGVLGLDFMKKHRCVVDIIKGTFKIGRQMVPMQQEGWFGCYKIALGETINIPPRTEIIVNGTICTPDGMSRPTGFGIVEGGEKFVNTEKGLVARTLVECGERIPVRMMNVSSEVKTVHSGTIVGNLSPVEQVVENDTKSGNGTKTLPSKLNGLLDQASERLNREQREKVKQLLLRNSTLFAQDDCELGKTNVIKHKIKTDGTPPIRQPLRRVPVHLQAEVEKHVNDMIDRDVIEPSQSPWSSGVVLVKKKDGSTRFCVDYRKLNAHTVKDAYPLPRIDESMDHLSGACWFSTLDLCSGYWQVEMDPEDRAKTAFVTKQGLFQWKVMPFGLCNAPATFERLMETVLSGLQWDVCLVYLDDVIVMASSFDGMLQNLQEVFERLKSAGLKLKIKKCRLFAKEVEYLGHIINEQGVQTDPKKIKAIQQWPEPRHATDVRSFLGLCSYYRKFIKDFAKIARPLHKLTEKQKGFQWTSECQEAFDTLKSKLTNSPILSLPDLTKEFILDTDASNFAIGAVLSQKTDDGEKVIAYASRALSKSERKYCVTRKELLAVVHFVKYFRHYLYGRHFVVRTDHSSLKWLLNFKQPEGQLARWLEVLGTYDVTIEHRPGAQHKNADALSRHSCKQCFEKIPKEQALCSIDLGRGNEDLSLKEAQNKDKDIARIVEMLSSEKVLEKGEVRAGSLVLKALWSQRQTLVVQDGILFRKWIDHKGVTLQAVVPSSERRSVLQMSHDHKTAGHLGVTKTLSKIRQSYYWPGLQRDVRQYVAGCEPCTKGKSSGRNQRAPMQMEGSGMPMQRIAMDLLGELPLTEKGNRYVLVVADYYTKWTEAFPLPNMEARTVAEKLVTEVISRLGVPHVIHTDQGRQFESQLFRELCQILNINKTRTSPYHPQSDGMVERFNKTLAGMLKSFVNEHHTDWDEHLPYVMMAYRSTEQETTGCSPNYLMLGREVATPLDISYEMPTSIKDIPVNTWAWELKERLEEAHKFVRRNVDQAMLRQKTLYDQKLKWKTFAVDEEVYVYFPRYTVGTSKKLTQFWRGPFKVVSKCTDVTYNVSCGPNGSGQVIHVDRMKKKHTQTLTNEIPTSDASTSGEQENGSLNDEPDESTGQDEKRVRRRPVWMEDYDVDI